MFWSETLILFMGLQKLLTAKDGKEKPRHGALSLMLKAAT